MSIILLVGPSHVGKTTLSKKVASKMNITHQDMDLVADIRTPGHFERAAVFMKQYEGENQTFLIDFGAGFQNNEQESLAILTPFADRMITIWGKPEIVFLRHTRVWEEFLNTEYREFRKLIYSLSKNRLNTTGSVEADAVSLENIIVKIQHE